ncbi:MAG: beta-lactamase family protein [Acidobacteriia bacterium]|nr:beta-lactamase family protein [Terriglobia bacterium]
MQKARAGVALLSLSFVACAFVAGAPASKEPSAVDPAKAGWTPAALDELAAYVQSQKTTGFLIIQDRKVIFEHNWPLPADAANFAANFTHGTDAHGALQEDVASAQKSFIAVLAGVAIDKGLLDLSKPVSDYIGPGWSKATREQEKSITVRNLMEMSSGLTEKLTFEAPAGAKFFYNTPAYAILKPVLEKASGKKLDDLTRLWLTQPAGMKDTLWRERPAVFANVGNATGLYTTPRDMAKLGQLVLDGGKAADGKRVISMAQLAALFERSATNPAYGRLWWLNGSSYTLRPAGARSETELIPAAPAELVAALGAQDRKIYIVRSRKLIVVRTGQAAPDRSFDQQVWVRLMKAAPKD